MKPNVKAQSEHSFSSKGNRIDNKSYTAEWNISTKYSHARGKELDYGYKALTAWPENTKIGIYQTLIYIKNTL